MPTLHFIPDPDWRSLMSLWLRYHRDIHKPYRSQMGVRRCFTHLKNLSQNDIATARQIVDQSIANNYQGLFPLKTSSNGQKLNSAGTTRIQQRKLQQQQYQQELADLIARKLGG